MIALESEYHISGEIRLLGSIHDGEHIQSQVSPGVHHSQAHSKNADIMLCADQSGGLTQLHMMVC